MGTRETARQNAGHGSRRYRRRSATHPTLIVIGGREDKIGDALILPEVARHAEKRLAVYDVKLHLLTEGDAFDLKTRRPTSFGALQHIRTLEASVPSSD